MFNTISQWLLKSDTLLPSTTLWMKYSVWPLSLTSYIYSCMPAWGMKYSVWPLSLTSYIYSCMPACGLPIDDVFDPFYATIYMITLLSVASWSSKTSLTAYPILCHFSSSLQKESCCLRVKWDIRFLLKFAFHSFSPGSKLWSMCKYQCVKLAVAKSPRRPVNAL